MSQLITKSDIEINMNFRAVLRRGGKIVPGSRREGHNVFTNHGRDWLSRLVGWKQLASGGVDDKAFTQRRIRWVGVGTGTQLELATVTQITTPAKATATDYFIPIQVVDYPTTTSVRFVTEFGAAQISLLPTDIVTITEAALFTDVQRVGTVGGLDDLPYDGVGGSGAWTLNPTVQNNPPVAYKAFIGIPKTTDFTFEIQWTLRIG